jgi:hypothetical protein
MNNIMNHLHTLKLPLTKKPQLANKVVKRRQKQVLRVNPFLKKNCNANTKKKKSLRSKRSFSFSNRKKKKRESAEKLRKIRVKVLNMKKLKMNLNLKSSLRKKKNIITSLLKI